MEDLEGAYRVVRRHSDGSFTAKPRGRGGAVRVYGCAPSAGAFPAAGSVIMRGVDAEAVRAGVVRWRHGELLHAATRGGPATALAWTRRDCGAAAHDSLAEEVKSALNRSLGEEELARLATWDARNIGASSRAGGSVDEALAGCRVALQHARVGPVKAVGALLDSTGWPQGEATDGASASGRTEPSCRRDSTRALTI
ncbi:hypothetical protein M885DRAFT_165795 [Pelagophyceae sp. CCMP2097]|nr:hypothetical protein M885DRAFT_165795 [Pelagophyceae sp. CCMP2097]